MLVGEGPWDLPHTTPWHIQGTEMSQRSELRAQPQVSRKEGFQEPSWSQEPEGLPEQLRGEVGRGGGSGGREGAQRWLGRMGVRRDGVCPWLPSPSPFPKGQGLGVREMGLH